MRKIDSFIYYWICFKYGEDDDFQTRRCSYLCKQSYSTNILVWAACTKVDLPYENLEGAQYIGTWGFILVYFVWAVADGITLLIKNKALLGFYNLIT